MTEKERMRLGAIILAGGRSTRMGQPKESLPFAGDTLLGRACRTLLTCTTPVLVVKRDAAQPLPPLPAGVEVATDATPDSGPLAAIAAGLSGLADHHGFGAADAAFVCACDQPFLTQAAVRGLADRLGDAPLVMPRVAGRLQPLGAIYRLVVRPHVEALLASGTRTPRTLAELPGVRVLDDSELRAFDAELLAWVNVNTVPDLEAAMARQPRRTSHG